MTNVAIRVENLSKRYPRLGRISNLGLRIANREVDNPKSEIHNPQFICAPKTSPLRR